MVKSKFCWKMYFSMVVVLILSLLSVFMVVISIRGLFIGNVTDMMILLLISCAFTFLFLYLLIRLRTIMVYGDGIMYHSTIFPFLKGQLTIQDVDYFVIQRNNTNGYYTFDALLLIKKSKKRMVITPVVYSNCNEMAKALPWYYRGEYRPGFWDEFRITTINENKIISE